MASCPQPIRCGPCSGPGLPGAPCHMFLAPQVLVHSRSAEWQPLDLGLAAGYPPQPVRPEAPASRDFPPSRQGNCYVWNLTGGIGDEVTQLIPKTKIPAHTRYALQCRFSPDSTCVQGRGAGGGVPGAGGLMRWVCLEDSTGVRDGSGC